LTTTAQPIHSQPENERHRSDRPQRNHGAAAPCSQPANPPDVLRTTIQKHDAAYQQARARQPALGAYATAMALFDALSIDTRRDTRLDSRTQQLLLRVVVVEYQRDRHPLWHAMAVRGLEPILGNLRALLYERDPEELEQDLQVALIEVLGRLRVVRAGGPIFPFLTVRRAIWRALFERDGASAEPREDAPFDECVLASPHPQHEDAQPFVGCLAREVAERVLRQPGGEGLIRVLAGAETLLEQAERLSWDDATYDRMQKRQRRSLERVRRELAPEER
jgi:hypothetical protein